MKQTIKVGQVLYRDNRTLEPSEEIVNSVGRKYFTVESDWRYKYDISTLIRKDEYGSIKLYLTKEEIILRLETNILIGKLRGFFYNKINLPIEKMREVSDIIDKYRTDIIYPHETTPPTLDDSTGKQPENAR